MISIFAAVKFRVAVGGQQARVVVGIVVPLKLNPPIMLSRTFCWNGHGSMCISLIVENNRTMSGG